MCKKKYIHYGSNHFDSLIFEEITNQTYSNKPNGGLWASPVDSVYGWKDWCKGNNYKIENLDRSFEFTLADDARVLYLNDVIAPNGKECLLLDKMLEYSKAIRLPHSEYSFTKDGYFMDEIRMDFELLHDILKYDAIEVRLDSFFYWKLYGWDVDSLLVMNPRVIVESKGDSPC